VFLPSIAVGLEKKFITDPSPDPLFYEFRIRIRIRIRILLSKKNSVAGTGIFLDDI
jgi:hypothetical protein